MATQNFSVMANTTTQMTGIVIESFVCTVSGLIKVYRSNTPTVPSRTLIVTAGTIYPIDLSLDENANGIGYITTNGTAAGYAIVSQELIPSSNSQVTPALSGLGVSSGIPRGGCLGDSRLANGFGAVGAVAQGFKAVGPVTWARGLSGQRFAFDVADNYATSGYTTADLINNGNLARAAASSCTFIILLASVNDRTNINPLTGQLFTAAESIANLTTIITTLTVTGKQVFIVAELPYGDGSTHTFTTAQLGAHLQVRRWIQRQRSQPLVHVVDVFNSLLADPTSLTAITWGSGLTFDGYLHPAGGGAYVIGLGLAAAINTFYPPSNILPCSNADAFDAVNNPTGLLMPASSLNPNPMMGVGLAGQQQGTNAGTNTANVADNWKVELLNGTGLTVTPSIVTINGQKWQQLVIGGTGTSSLPQVGFRTSAGAALAGDTVEGTAEVQVDAGQTGLQAIGLHVTNGDATLYGQDFEVFSGTVGNWPTAAVDIVEKTSPVTLAADGTIVQNQLLISCIQNVAVSATVRIRAMGVRKQVTL